MPLESCNVQKSAVISLSEPHKFMSVSDEICALFNFAHDQIHGHSIEILQGPKTDTTLLSAAIKAAQMGQHCTVPLTIYRRDGSECDVTISCCAHIGEDGEVDGLRMDFRPTTCSEHNRAEMHELALYEDTAVDRNGEASLLEELLDGIEVE